MNDNNQKNRWAEGWAFYKSGGVNSEYLPPINDCGEWIKGYAVALADYDLEPYREHPSIQAALLHHGIDGDLNEACLQAAEANLAKLIGGEWCRWPTVPVRGFEVPTPQGWTLVEAANVEMG
jgi:hypothetical protein